MRAVVADVDVFRADVTGARLGQPKVLVQRTLVRRVRPVDRGGREGR